MKAVAMLAKDINDALVILRRTNGDEKCCRACLNIKPHDDVVFIYGTEDETQSPAHFIELLTNTPLLRGNDLPNFICKKCSLELDIAACFKAKIIYANDLLIEAAKIIAEEIATNKTFTGKKIGALKSNAGSSSDREENSAMDLAVDVDHINEEVDDNATDSSLQIIKNVVCKVFECRYCEYKTSKYQYMIAHDRSHTGERPFSCEHCGKSFSQKATLWAHRKTHSSATYYMCPECGKQFKHRSAYTRHIVRTHSSGSRHQCDICQKYLKSTELLQMHKKRHMNIKSYSCEYCGKGFVTRPELIRHQNTHLVKKKTHECPICHHKSSTKGNLTVHVRMHSGEKPFTCTQCSLRCRTNAQLNIHMRTHSKVLPYTCIKCYSKFRYSSSLNRHMAKAHGIKYSHGKVCDRRIVK